VGAQSYGSASADRQTAKEKYLWQFFLQKEVFGKQFNIFLLITTKYIF
jgi:hypothetical protein